MSMAQNQSAVALADLEKSVLAEQVLQLHGATKEYDAKFGLTLSSKDGFLSSWLTQYLTQIYFVSNSFAIFFRSSTFGSSNLCNLCSCSQISNSGN